MAFQLAKRKKKAYFRNFLLKKFVRLIFFLYFCGRIIYRNISCAYSRARDIIKEDKRK